MQVSIHLESRAKDVERWSRGDVSGTLVKSNSGRSVWHVPVGSPGLYVKCFPPELLRDRAKKEADLLAALHQARIPCPRLVALARDKEGSYILTEEIPDARPLSEILPHPGPRARVLLQDLGRLAKKLHDAGFDHQDFHAGNVLVRDRDLYVIDVHRATRKKSLSRDRRFDGLAFTAMSFVETRPRTDLLRFLRAYGIHLRQDWVDVWNRLRKRHAEYFLGRQKRVFKEGSGFGVQGTVHYRKGIDLGAILRRVRTGTREFIRKTKTESLERVDGSLFVKTTTPSRAKRIWENAHGLALRGIDTPTLWAWDRSWVAGEWVDSVDLHDFIRLQYGALRRVERLAFLFRLARRIRRLHDYGCYHKDLKAGNILVGGGRILIIDLDPVRFSDEVPEDERLYNLAQLNAAVTPPLTRTDRLRFLNFYVGNCASLRARRGDWVRDIMTATRQRKHRWPPT
ncbi:MAG TPA: lipopolysaccharide kinase InaA family protein [Planctomycetota bacterium]|nr:lipopolysaccharide kinase InaA family protein [Planctomycetota bacterium]